MASQELTLFMLGNFSCFCCRLLHFFFFQNYFFLQISFRNTSKVSDSFDSDQDRHSGSKLFAKVISRQ